MSTTKKATAKATKAKTKAAPKKKPIAKRTTKDAKVTKAARAAKPKKPEPSRFVWDPKVSKDREAAQEVFNIFRRKHFLVSRVNGDGKPGEQMDVFDPQAGVMVFNPAPTRYGRIAKAEL